MLIPSTKHWQNSTSSVNTDLLRERPVEAGVDPLFEIVAEDKERGLADEAFIFRSCCASFIAFL